MRINGIIWLRDVIDKLAFKPTASSKRKRRRCLTIDPSSVSLKKESAREKMYTWRSGKATRVGIWRSFHIQEKQRCLILSARTMAPKERRLYGKK